MKNFTFVGIALILLSSSGVPLLAQTDYDGWVTKARAILSDPVAEKTGINQKWELGLNKVRGAEALVEAAKLAPDDAKKFDAYYEAGELFRGELKSDGAAKAYGAARDIVAGPTDKRAEAGYYAAINFQQSDYNKGEGKRVPAEVIAEYEKALAIKDAPSTTKANIHEKYAYFLGTQNKYWEAAQHYEKAADLTPPNGDRVPSAQDQLYYSANSNAAKLPPSPQVRVFIEGIFKKQMVVRQTLYAAKPKDFSLSAMSLRHSQARRLLEQGAPEQAFALWTETGVDTNLDKGQRYSAWKEIGDEQGRRKLWPAAVKTWDTAAKIPDLPWVWFKEAGIEKAEAYAAQNDYKNARTQLEALIASPSISPVDKLALKLSVAKYHGRESAFLLPTNPALAATAKNEAVKIYDAFLADPTTSLNVQVDAIKQLAQFDLNEKNIAGAVTRLNDALKRFDQMPIGYGRHMLNTIARVYLSQNQFKETMDSLQSSAIYPNFTRPIPDNETQQIAGNAFNAAVKAKNWTAAQDIVAVYEKWGQAAIDVLMMRLQIDIESGDFAAARTHVAQIEKQTFISTENKKKLEAWKLKIPAP